MFISMKIIITKKASYLIIVLLVFLLTFVSINAEYVNVFGPFHSIDQIFTSGGIPVDKNNNSIIDISDYANHAEWNSISTKGYICPKNQYLVGYKGYAPICRKLRIECGDEEPMCNITFFSDPYYNLSISGDVRNKFSEYDLNKMVPSKKLVNTDDKEIKENLFDVLFVAKDPFTDLYWASLSDDIVVSMDCVYTTCKINQEYRIDNPREISFDEKNVYVLSSNSTIYTITKGKTCFEQSFSVGDYLSHIRFDKTLGLVFSKRVDLNNNLGLISNQKGTFILNRGEDGSAFDISNDKEKVELIYSDDDLIKHLTYNSDFSSILVDDVINLSEGLRTINSETLKEYNFSSSEIENLILYNNIIIFDIDSSVLGYHNLNTKSYNVLYTADNNLISSLFKDESKLYVVLYNDTNQERSFVKMYDLNTMKDLGNLIISDDKYDDLEVLENCS